MGTLALITIGQSPRTDLTPELKELLPVGTTLLERGALDALTTDEINAMTPRDGDVVLTSRLRDGTAAIMGRQPLIARLQDLISSVETEADVLMLACTGEFPAFSHTTPLIEPDVEIRKAVAANTASHGSVGIICPLVDQQESSVEKLAAGLPPTVQFFTAVATPYSTGQTALAEAAVALHDSGVDLIVLDCIGYTEAMGRLVEEICGVPVLLSRAVAGQVAAALLTGLGRAKPSNHPTT